MLETDIGRLSVAVSAPGVGFVAFGSCTPVP